MNDFVLLLLAYSMVIFTVSLLGGKLSAIVTMNHTRTQLVMSFVAGFLLGVAMYHLLFARKNRRWIHITLALMAGGSLFLPWLPTVLKGLEGFSNKSFSGMSAFESLVSLGNVYSNDFWLLPLGALIIIAWHRKLLGKPQRFLLVLTFLAIAVLLLAHEIKPILIAKRLRYMLLLVPLLGSALAIAWHFGPESRSDRTVRIRPLIRRFSQGVERRQAGLEWSL